MNQYIITEELLRNYRRGTITFEDIEAYVRSRPFTQQEQIKTTDRISCVHMEVCKFKICNKLCDYYCSLNSEREKVLDELDAKIMQRVEELFQELQASCNDRRKGDLIFERRCGIGEVLDMIAKLRQGD